MSDVTFNYPAFGIKNHNSVVSVSLINRSSDLSEYKFLIIGVC